MSAIVELRRHLFETLSALKDKENPMEIERAKAVHEVAQVIINSAKAETDHMRVSGRVSKSGFFPAADNGNALTGEDKPHGNAQVSTVPGGRMISHRLGG